MPVTVLKPDKETVADGVVITDGNFKVDRVNSINILQNYGELVHLICSITILALIANWTTRIERKRLQKCISDPNYLRLYISRCISCVQNTLQGKVICIRFRNFRNSFKGFQNKVTRRKRSKNFVKEFRGLLWKALRSFLHRCGNLCSNSARSSDRFGKNLEKYSGSFL